MRALILVGGAALIFSGCEDKAAPIKADIADIKTEITDNSDKVDDFKDNVSDVKADLRATEAKCETARRDLRDRIDRLESKLTESLRDVSNSGNGWIYSWKVRILNMSSDSWSFKISKFYENRFQQPKLPNTDF